MGYVVLQPLRWCCVDCVIHHGRDVREEQNYMYVARTSNNRVIPMEWSWWVTSNNAYEPGEQLIVLANGDDESDLVGWSLLLLAATLRSFAHMPLGISDRNSRTSTEAKITNHNLRGSSFNVFINGLSRVPVDINWTQTLRWIGASDVVLTVPSVNFHQLKIDLKHEQKY